MQRFLNGLTVGLSTEKKPTNLSFSKTRPTTWLERDTRRQYILGNNLRWILQKQDPLNLEGEADFPVAVQVKEYGDHFPTIQPKHVIMMDSSFLENGNTKISSMIGSDKFVYSNAAPLIISKDAPFEGHSVFNTANGARQITSDSPTTSYFGTNGFFAGIWFRASGVYQNQTLFQIGRDGSGASVKLSFDTDNNLIAKITDGTNTYSVTLPGYEFLSGQWNYAAMWYDKSNTSAKKLHLFVGNPFVVHAHQSTAVNTLNSLDNSSGTFVIGKTFNGTTYSNGFRGEMSNFQSYVFSGRPDHASMRMFMSGIREPPLKGYTASLIFSNPTQRQFGSTLKLAQTGANGSEHINYMFASDEGVYNFDLLYHGSASYNDVDLYIDNAFYTTIALSQSTVNNNMVTLDGIHLSKGIHFLKLVAKENTTTSTSSTNFAVDSQLGAIMLNKVDGDTHHTYQGASSFIFFGNEARKRSGRWELNVGSSIPRWRSVYTQATSYTPQSADYLEFDVFTQAGLHQIALNITGSNFGGYGIAKLLVDDNELFSIDGHTSSSSQTSLEDSCQVYLDGGPHKIKVRVDGKNPSSSGFRLKLNAVRSELIKEDANDTGTNVYASDSDIADVTGTSSVSTSNVVNSRFSIYRNVGTSGKVSVRRFFAGGFYHVRFLTPAGNGVKVKIDGTEIVESVYVHPVQPVGTDAAVMISRGYHDVTVEATNPTNTTFNAILFKLVAKIKLAGDKTYNMQKPGLVPIGLLHIKKDTNSQAIKLGNVTKTRYDTILIDSEPVISGAQSSGLCVMINDINAANKYTMNGVFRRPNDSTYNNTSSNFVWSTTAIFYSLQEMVNVTGLVPTQGKFEIKMIDKGSSVSVFGKIKSYNDIHGKVDASWTLVDSISSIKKLGFCMSTQIGTPLIKAGSVIEVYARKRT